MKAAPVEEAEFLASHVVANLPLRACSKAPGWRGQLASMRSTTEVGIDVSYYQGEIVWTHVKRAGVKFAFGKEPVFVREGGSIGAVLSMEKVLKCPVMFLGLSLPEHGYHAPNENFDWQQASGGMVAFAKYFEEIANLHENEGKKGKG